MFRKWGKENGFRRLGIKQCFTLFQRQGKHVMLGKQYCQYCICCPDMLWLEIYSYFFQKFTLFLWSISLSPLHLCFSLLARLFVRTSSLFAYVNVRRVQPEPVRAGIFSSKKALARPTLVRNNNPSSLGLRACWLAYVRAASCFWHRFREKDTNDVCCFPDYKTSCL